MRIVFLTHNYPRHAGDVSGAFLATLVHALVARGHDLRVIAPSDGGETGEPMLDGIPVERVRYAAPGHETLAYRGTMAEAARSPVGAWRAWRMVRALRAAAQRAVAGGAQVIHAHWWIPAGLAAPRGVPLVVTLHGTDAELLGRSAAARWLARPVLRRARVVTAVSAAAAARLRQATGRDLPASCLQPMPVDVARFGGAGAGGGGMVSVARLTRQKRVDLALRAMAVAGTHLPPLTIVGDGPERGALEALAAGLGLGSRVTFTGAMPPAGVAAVLSRADLALFPAENEGFGLAAVEALMAGVPVVACHDGGGVLSVVPAVGAGRVVAPTPTAIAQAARELLADPAARGLARTTGEGWRDRLSPARVAAVCEEWYREALGA
ncbi:MAG: glycosyltransferase [Gemmatimonadetes bacterium]|nr:glycosyltransferase [Gemmatimonadota bacterium]MBK7714261.1 glycosyltransferase [Gemmatimonadota bacterium]MBK7924265.1 glycosyltransferase [Gemmatimonadota bacterium]MBK9691489.1 glycosyltransferase [Gemmatimonadota bacterium]